MWEWLPATILGFAIMPFSIGMMTFIIWWFFLTFEPTYVRNYDGLYERKEYKGSTLWALIGSGLLVWLVYTAMGGVSWEKFQAFYPGFLRFCTVWVVIGLAWAPVRWIIEAYRGRKIWDRNAFYLASKRRGGDVGKLTPKEKFELSEVLPQAKDYRWRFFRWMMLWPASFLDTFLRDMVKLVWEWIYNVVSMFLDKLARKIYGHRYYPDRPEDAGKAPPPIS